MKNKFLAIFAAGTATLGGSLASAPAQALTATNVTTVNVNVPEVLILKTVPSITLNLDSSAILSGIPTSGGISTDSNGNLIYQDISSGQPIVVTNGTPNGGVDQTSPAQTGANVIPISLNNVYAVWSNSGATTGTFNVVVAPGNSGTLTGGGTATGGTAILAVSSGGTQSFTPQGLVTPALVGNIAVTVDLTNATKAGPYAGTLTITANTP